MACSIHCEKDFEHLKNHAPKPQISMAPGTKVIKLQRGGYIVTTSLGNIQFGMPPETVKDCMNLGMDVPNHFIVPGVKFDPKYGLNLAEFEFPAYFNFFIKRKKINLICTEQSMKEIRTVFQETLLGPTKFDNFREDFASTFEEGAMPNIVKELEFFAKNPFTKENLVIDHLIGFTCFDPVSKTAKLDDKVSIKYENGEFRIQDGEEEIAKIADRVQIEVQSDFKDYDLKSKGASSIVNEIPEKIYDPPVFGVTALGASHGFDPRGSTSGYIFWINGRGVMVDPPPFSSVMLKKLGIPATLIDSVIITHCHADHDAGTFQKILDSQQIQIITTKTILESFLRKYSALSGMSQEYLRGLFRFRPAKIGDNINVNNATFNFFYTLHSIPCIGFTVSMAGKSIYFSGDTFYDPEALQKMVEGGFISRKRFKSLSENKWNHTLIIHEAGVPPIHTPMKVFVNLPKEVKERLYLVHVAEKDIPHDQNLKGMKDGIQNTIILESARPEGHKVLSNLDLLCSIPIFEDLSVRCARDMLQVMKEEEFKCHDIIVEEGTYGDKFYLIKRGITKVFSHKAGNEFERFMTVGDYFGESAVVGDNMRHATCIAASDVTLLSIDKDDFWMIFGSLNSGAGVLKRLMNLKDSRKSSGFKAILKNSLLSSLSGSQKTQLEVLLKEEKYDKGFHIWKKGDHADKLLIVGSGIVKFVDCKEEELGELSNGDLIGEMDALLKGGLHRTTLEAVTPLIVFAIKKRDFVHFLQSNPGLNVIFLNLLVAD